MPSSLRYDGFLGKYICISFLLVALLVLTGFTALGQTPSASDDEVTIAEDFTAVIKVLENDSNYNSDPANRNITIVEGPEHGAVTHDDTEIQYHPDENFNGSDSLVYRITNVGGGSSEATVTIEVVSVNDPPIPEKGLFTTTENTTVTIVLSATDGDIDPMRPDRHPIEFELLGEPTNGDLEGNIEDVKYESPNRAFVELEYSPDPSFRGVETLNYRVEDEFGSSNISSISIDVIAEGEAPVSFSGYLGSSITLEKGDPTLISDVRGNLTTIYRYADVELRSDSTWSEESLETMRFRGELPLGIVDLSSTLSLDPTAAFPFNYWQSSAELEFSEIDIRNIFQLAENSDSTYYRLEGRWTLENMYFFGSTRFSGPEPQFEESSLRTRWRCPDCDLTVNTDIGFTDEGFDAFSVDIGDFPLFYGTYFEFETTFTSTSKEVSPSLFYRSEWIDCFKILAELETNESNNALEGFSVYGIRFRNNFPNGLTLRIDTSIDEDKNSSVTGDSSYSQKFSLSGPFYVDYRSPGKFLISTYLDSVGSEKLFGWGKSRLKAVAPISENLDLNSELTITAAEPTITLTLGGEISW